MNPLTISIVALVVAIVTAIYTMIEAMAGRRSAAAAEQANSLTRQAQEEQRARLERLEADRLAACIRVVTELRRSRAGAWFIVIENLGPAVANDIGLEIRGTKDGVISLLADGSYFQRRSELRPDEQWSLRVSTFSPANVYPIDGTVIWRDQTARTDEFRITGAADTGPFVEP